ncbi:hypothetical protein CUMW_259320 [Citrus unshiu]|uniref:Uncharacterized protein n=1 Tax=Citrus unshiu TaxID=55188 RepID=A0A2H5QT93_CITUN|nr:hypothetical protein CUMW_259320 [Citrus unshiu]
MCWRPTASKNLQVKLKFGKTSAKKAQDVKTLIPRSGAPRRAPEPVADKKPISHTIVACHITA